MDFSKWNEEMLELNREIFEMETELQILKWKREDMIKAHNEAIKDDEWYKQYIDGKRD